MAEGAFDEADIEVMYDNFGCPSGRMTPIDPPLHNLKPLGQVIS